MTHRDQGRVGEGRRRRGPRAGIEKAQFPEQFAGPEDRQQTLPAVRGGVPEFHLPLGDDEHAVTALALHEEILALGQPHLHGGRLQGSRSVIIEGSEQGGLAQDVIHPPSLSHNRRIVAR
jgi:hypothetical protein